MRKKFIWAVWLLFLIGLMPMVSMAAGQLSVQQEDKGDSGREKLNFNQGWKFVRADIREAVQVDYPMEELERWENVDLPHAVRLEPYINSGGLNYQGPAMYRKHFALPEDYKGKKIYIEFEGVMGVTDVWINGIHQQGKMAEKTGANTQYGGYLPFILDVTGAVNCDGTFNVITVLTDNSDNYNVPPGKPQSQLDFTYFGGIYRNAWLEVTDPVHITDAVYEDITAGGGILVDYPEVSKESAVVAVDTHIRNEDQLGKEVTLKTELVDEKGNVVQEQSETKRIPAGEDAVLKQKLEVQNPSLWNLENPHLYTLVSTVTVEGRVADREENRIGIRKITMSKDTGLLINGEEAGFLSGVNRHQEYPYIGYAASSSLQRRDAVKFKSAGFNIVRTAHTVQSIDFIEACDELGILVMECVPGWQHWSSDDVFAVRVQNDIRQMVRRTRNHPSILCYEISLNETSGMPSGFTNECNDVAKEEHPSVITSAENPHNGANSDILYGTPSEVAGWSNTAMSLIREYADYWEEQNGNFTDKARVTRGPGTFYPGGEGAMIRQAENKLWNGYTFVGTGGISLSEGIRNYETSNKRFIGVTMWIGIDHNRGYHPTMSPCGLWDLRRIPKYSYYAFESQREQKKNTYLESKGVETGLSLFIASSWGERAPVVDKTDQTIGSDESRKIQVYANTDKVRLSVISAAGEVLWSAVNTPIQEKTAGYLEHPPFIFQGVPYTAGSYLKAEGLGEGEEVLIYKEVHTAGEPAKLKLEADFSGYGLTADGSDTVMVYAYVLDKDGNLCQEADNKLYFYIEGDGRILGNGDKRVGANPVQAEAGITGVLVQAGKTPGDITLCVQADGMEDAELIISSDPMTQKYVAYEEIKQGPSIEYQSAYLTEKEEIISGEDRPSIGKSDVTINETVYENSIQAKNMLRIEYDLGGHYSRFTAGAALLEPEKSKEGAVFKVYADGVLKYASPRVKEGIQEMEVDVSGCDTLVITAEDRHAVNTGSMLWLSPYIYEGTTAEDESELRENLALEKSASASSTDSGTSAKAAVDGNITTLWRSAQPVTEGNSQEWILDLGAEEDIRNARLAVEQDYLKCSYEIHTSADGKDWKQQAAAAKTAHGNEVPDLFTAGGVRYVKVVFTKVESTQGEGEGRIPKASIKEFEVYRDRGVETVRDYNLKGMEIAGLEIPFSAGTTEYNLPTPGFGTEFYVKALPANHQSGVTVNGEQISSSPASDLSEISYHRTALSEDNEIVIEVTSPDGKGKKAYTFRITDQEGQGERYDALQCFVPGINGANCWSYQVLDKSSGQISDMDHAQSGYVQGEYAWHGSSEWIYSGPRYMHPREDTSAVRTFTAPKDGILQYEAEMEKFAGQPGEVSFAVWKNGEKIWPSGSNAASVTPGNPLKTSLQLQIRQGEQLQLVMDSCGGNGGDATGVITRAFYTDRFQIESAAIFGKGILIYQEGHDLRAAYTLQLKNELGQEIQGVPFTWKVKEETEGISVSEDGELTVDQSVTEGRCTLQAICQGEVLAEKNVRVVNGTFTYLSDLEWTEASSGDGNEVFRDRAHSGGQIRLTGEDGEAKVYEKGIGTHAPSKVTINVKDQGYAMFAAMVGVDYSQNPDGYYASVRFQVYFDGEEENPAYDSGEMKCDTPQKEICIEIPEGTRTITLYAEQGENNWSDHADWADAKFVKAERSNQKDLEALVRKAEEKLEGDYEETLLERLREALADAKAVLEDHFAPQEEVDESRDRLKEIYEELEQIEEEQNGDRKAAEAVEQLIADIGKVTLESKEKIDAATAAYQKLTDRQKALVENDEMLAEAIKEYERLVAQEDEEHEDREAADVVTAQILAIGEVTLDAGDAIAEARAAYEGLTGPQKSYVKVLPVLETAEKAYEKLAADEKAYQKDKKAADEVITKILDIGVVTLEKGEAITEARNAYQGLTKTQKTMVFNYHTLVNAEHLYQQLMETHAELQALQTAIHAARGLQKDRYTKESFDKVQKALKRAAEADKEDAEEVSHATAALIEAICGLREKKDEEERKIGKSDKSGEEEASSNLNKSYSDKGLSGKKATKKGSVHTVDHLLYRIVRTSAKGGTATLIKPESKTVTSITIPAFIKISGRIYKVTAVSRNACKGSKSLEKVTVGKNVAHIGDFAFYKCTKLREVSLGTGTKTIGRKAFYGDEKLKKLTVRSRKLKKAGSQCLKGISKKAVIQVPEQKLADYKRMLKSKGQKLKVKGK